MHNSILFLTIGLSNIPDVSTEEMTNKINSAVGEVDALVSGSFYNIAVIAFLIVLVIFILCATVLKSKFAVKAAASMGCIFLAIILFSMRFQIIGWFSHIGKGGL
ncbi:hypothetical protein [Clostridioides difficile]|uniref:hypothetical protein n=1 Tax=Clostridioides difficile TaxID=1496 RepID=UPI0021C650B8|nr:hypothetical protein [Clostridioides difficile]UUV16670.1 hypothetical protein NQ183_20305 [Clostridioides difficile]